MCGNDCKISILTQSAAWKSPNRMGVCAHWAYGTSKLLCVLSKMLKAPIQGEGMPTKGVPQGGILRPLLSNVVLNELDWWISSQWGTFPTKTNYTHDLSRYQNLRRTSRVKEIFIVRYADDFKLFYKCRIDAVQRYGAGPA